MKKMWKVKVKKIDSKDNLSHLWWMDKIISIVQEEAPYVDSGAGSSSWIIKKSLNYVAMF